MFAPVWCHVTCLLPGARCYWLSTLVVRAYQHSALIIFTLLGPDKHYCLSRSPYGHDTNMAAKGTNRYALFGDGKVSPMSSPTTITGSNPFANQVADDSSPWQEVKKRGAMQLVAHGKSLGMRDQTRAAHAHGSMQGRVRERTTSTTSDGECSIVLRRPPAHTKMGRS
jgi:hypothetical protein